MTARPADIECPTTMVSSPAVAAAAIARRPPPAVPAFRRFRRARAGRWRCCELRPRGARRSVASCGGRTSTHARRRRRASTFVVVRERVCRARYCSHRGSRKFRVRPRRGGAHLSPLRDRAPGSSRSPSSAPTRRSGRASAPPPGIAGRPRPAIRAARPSRPARRTHRRGGSNTVPRLRRTAIDPPVSSWPVVTSSNS